MGPIRFEANFTSALGAVLHPAIEGDASKSFSARVQWLLAQAQSDYSAQHYADAIRHYSEAQSLIFWLLHPRHPVRRHIADPRLQLPVGADLETAIAEASLALAEAAEPYAASPLPPVGVTGARIPAEATRFDALGYLRDGGVAQSARDQAALGVDLLGRGLADQASSVLQTALTSLGQPGTAEARELAASVALNLSTAHVLTGRTADAEAAAATAQQLFQGLQDPAGQAQALHNQAVALHVAGDDARAKPIFDQAAQLIKPVVGAPQRTPATVIGHALLPITARLPGHEGPSATVAAEQAGAPVQLLAAAAATAPASLVAPLSPAPEVRAVASTRDLAFVGDQEAGALALRLPGSAVAGGSQDAAVAVPTTRARPSWSWNVPAPGGKVVELAWKDGARPAAQTLIDSVFRPRVTARTLAELAIVIADESQVNAYLTHIYAFVIPQGLGDCHSQLGDYELAQSLYLQAAQYSYVNQALEVPALWARLASNIQRWGDSLYRLESIDDCQAVYARLLTRDGAAANDSPLYSLPVFAGPAADARKLIAALSDPGSVSVDPGIAHPLLVVWARWQNLLAGLDFFGTTFTPILTFEYLQQTATVFAQQAVQAEREYVDFQSRSEAEAATRRELQSAAITARQAADAQRELWAAARSETAAANASVSLAQQRITEAQTDRNQYAVDGYWQYVSASIAAAHGAHSDWYGNEIRGLAANMESGSWHGDYGKLAAAATLLGGQKSYEYQLQRLQDAINDAQATLPIVQQQAAAAQHRENAAKYQYEAAQTRAGLAQDALNAFDNAVFTPEVWARMARVMRDLSQDYQDWAIRTAKLMERAYNFENDDDAHVIRSAYPGVTGADNLFGSDFLLRDIQSFSYRFIANQRARLSQLKDVISLANQYPFDFYRLQQTGQMRFETTLHDADVRHPGFYGQRIAGIELEVVGLLPPEGVHGTLRAGGLSRYRTADGKERTRIHTVDTLALSEYTMRNDAFVFRVDPRVHGLFEGHGVATTWLLDLPRRSNNLDYRLLTDVRLVLYYSAFYSPALHDAVLGAPPSPGEMVHTRSLMLRYDFPEVWYTLLDSGQADFTVDPSLLPRNETSFTTQQVAVQLLGGDGVDVGGVPITLTPPGKAAAAVSTDAGGRAQSATAGSPLAAQLGGAVLGPWHIAVRPPAGSPLLGPDGKLDAGKLDNVALLLQYQFAWPA